MSLASLNSRTPRPPQSEPAATITVAREAARALAAHAHHTFGLMGNGNAHLIDALGAFGMPFTAVRHEAATVAAADAFTRVSGALAIATTTYGAGFTNTLTALAEARQARTPMLVVVGYAPERGPRPWDIDQEQLALAVGVHQVTLSTSHVAESIARAAQYALQQREPVVIAIPYDIVNVSAGLEVQDVELRVEPSARSNDVDRERVSDLARVLASSRRPLILAGRGAHLAQAGAELDALQRITGAATASTALARGIFTDETMHLGVVGGFGAANAMEVVQRADVVLVVGAGLNQFTMRFGELFGEGARVIRIDAEQVQRPHTAWGVSHELLQGDAREVLRALIDELAPVTTEDAKGAEEQHVSWRGEVTRSLAQRGDEVAEVPKDGVCVDGRLDPRAVAMRLAELLPHDAYVTQDGGHFIAWANMFFDIASPERMTMVGTAYQTIGLGFGTVAGIAAAVPGETIVLSTGDGGGLMALADLETAIRTAESLVIIVWNDAAYGAEVHLYGEMGLDQAPMRIPHVNFAAVAEALGATGVPVNELADLEALTAWRAAGACGTLVLDCHISSTVVAPYQREVQRANGL